MNEFALYFQLTIELYLSLQCSDIYRHNFLCLIYTLFFQVSHVFKLLYSRILGNLVYNKIFSSLSHFLMLMLGFTK